MRFLAVCLVLLAALPPLAARGATSSQRLPKPSNATAVLSTQGHLLWNFEALLVRTFGRRPVSVSGQENFSCAGLCAPLSKYSPYRRVFANPTGSTFHLTARRFPAGAFGNYPEPVLIRGHTVACNARETRFLIADGDSVSLTLGCLAPRSMAASDLEKARAVLRAARGFTVQGKGSDIAYRGGKVWSRFLWTAKAKVSLLRNVRTETVLYSTGVGKGRQAARRYKYLARLDNYRLEVKEDAGPWRCSRSNDEYGGAALPFLSASKLSIISSRIAGAVVIRGARTRRIVTRVRAQPTGLHLPPITMTDYIVPSNHRLLRETLLTTAHTAGGVADVRFHRFDLSRYGEAVRVTVPKRCRV